MDNVDELSLSVLTDLSNSYIESLRSSSLNSLTSCEKLIHRSSEKHEVVKPTELLNYTKRHNSICFNDKTGPRRLRFPIVPKAKSKRTKPGKQKCKSHNKKDENIIGRDLAEGIEQFQPPNPEELYQINDLLRCVQHVIEESNCKEKCLEDFQILSLRRTLMMLVLLPITNKDCSFTLINWEGMSILDYNIDKNESERVRESNEAENSKQKLFSYCGLNFEQIVSESQDDDFGKGYYSFQRQQMSGITVHLAAEIDTSTSEDISDYVELKTQSALSPKERISPPTNYIAKLIHCWCQMVLVGCTHLLIGFRSKDLRLSSMKYMAIEEIRTRIDNSKYSLVDGGAALTCNKLRNWTKLLIYWLRSRSPGTYLITHARGDTHGESHLKIAPMDPAEATVHNRIPQWFKDYVHEVRSPLGDKVNRN